MKTSDFDYDLPAELIAQEPAAERDGCRLLVMDRDTGQLEDRIFRDIADYLRPNDLLVANETRVMPARLLGAKRGTGGSAEVFLLREVHDREPRTNRSALWEVLVRPGKRLKPGTGAVVDFADAQGDVALSAEIVDWADGAQKGERLARLTTTLPSLDEALHAVGHTPLPPYIKNYAGDEELYQTVYSRRESSAAAPTAGLHFTPTLIERLRDQGVRAGMLRIRYLRPMPSALIAEALRGAKAVGVLEKDVSFGAEGTVFTNVNSALQQAAVGVPTYNFVGGLGGDDISEAQVHGMYRMLVQAAEGTGELPRVSFLGIDSPADALGAERGR